MSNGRSPAVRSHRRGGSRRLRIAPWFVMSMVGVLVASGLTAGYLWVVKQACTGEVTATVVTSPRTAELMRTLAASWSETEPAVSGTCASVDIREQDNALTVEALTSETWNPAAAGPAPDVWVPQSSAWARAAAADSDFADQLLPDLLPSVARTPVVIAMSKTLAESISWPETNLDWKDLLDKLAQDPKIKLGMSDPATSTAGLLALSAIIDADDNTDVDNDELARVFALQQRIAVYKPTTEELFAEYLTGAGATLSAFPALEQDVLEHNLAHADNQLVAIYPNNATTEADLPYLVLDKASWTSPDRIGAARSFLDFLRGQSGRAAVLAQGFRDSNRAPGPNLTAEHGMVTELTALPRSVLLADSIGKTRYTWSALTRPTNLLLVLDVSGSMGAGVPGTGQTKLDLTKAAAEQAVGMFGKDARAGLWVFSSQQQGAAPYKELVKPGALSEAIGAVSRQDKIVTELRKLQPGGNTGMYDTVWAAHQSVQASYVPGADNLVVLLSDGADDDQGRGLSLAELTQRIEGSDQTKKVKVVTIALGKQANSSALDEIARVTGTQTYSSDRSYDIAKVLLGAMFGGI